MSPDRLEVRSQRLAHWKFTAALVWDRINPWLPRIPHKSSLLSSLAGIGAAACMPQTPQVQERPTPIIQVVTATPTETPPTPVPTLEPATATPKPEPTPRPPERFFQEISVLDIYTSDLFIIGKGKIGNILISRLPDDSILVAYNTLSPRTNGRKPTPIFLVPRNIVKGAGFQYNGPDAKFVVLLQGPSLGGQVEIKDLPSITEPALLSATNQGNGSDKLFELIAKTHNEVDSRVTTERAKDIVTRLYKGPLKLTK